MSIGDKINGVKSKIINYNFMRMGLKPVLKGKLGLKKIHWARLFINKKTDTIDLMGAGVVKATGNFTVVDNMPPLKLSEHQDWETAALDYCSRQIPAHKAIEGASISISYETNTVKGEVYFLNMADKKQKMVFESVF